MSGWAGKGSFVGREEIGREPGFGLIGANRLPRVSAIMRSEHSGRRIGSGLPEYNAMIPVKKADSDETRQRVMRKQRPGAAGIVRAKHNATRSRPALQAFTTDGPAVVCVYKNYRSQSASSIRLLLAPSLSTIVGVPDHTAIADGPAAHGVDEADVVERGIVAHCAENGQGRLRRIV